MAATIEEEDKVMATAKKIVESLNTSKEDMIMIFSRFDNRLSNITSLISGADGGDCKKGVGDDDDDPLVAAEKLILRWESEPESSRLWEESPNEAAEYLAAVDELLKLTEDSSDEDDIEDRDRAEIAIQLAMSRLEDEFRHILIRNTLPLDADRLYGSIRRVSLSFASHDGEIEDFESFGEEIEGYCHERGASLGDDLCVDLVHPDAVVELKEIADRMIRAKYEKECCQVYSSVRRDVIDECLSILGVEKLSIEEVQRIEWRSLDDKMKKWVQSVKVGVRVLLVGEKRLCEHLFEDSELIQEVCFVETAKGCVMQLLNFGEAVAIGKRSSEKLFRILDMYDVLANVLPDLEELFGGESGKVVCSEARGVMDGLGLAAIGTFVEFENAVQGEASRKPIQGGDIHPLTRYVMNYVKLLVDYSDSLNALLENSVDESGDSQRDDGDLPAECKSLFAQRLLSLIKSLESNLEEKSRMYEDGAMQYVFLMNNILYIVQKVKDSELGKLLGDQWVRKRRGQIRQYSTSYLRASWTKVLSCLKDEGIGGSTSNASKVALKERFKNFNACFEEIYRIQTAWKVPDAQLREELRISISEKVIPAYRSFMGRFGNHLESGRHAGKYIKYTPDDLENYLSDLFEGTPGVLNLTRRKST
ncbi:Exocyst complex component EXO70B1 like [Actinidia chinensis var. chinensis]|uniref:Exocyst subunit Exo70 family protein n=1 Tax=Actinidia chinensis var. chinensis TaxID=1590841 RepID=A0A2R6PDS0_ACTCC|nr:Exocyst complex component EXO70B1 like [Actinidia chinensis var. chinensis]